MVVAFEIRRPFPQKTSLGRRPEGRFEWKRHGAWWKPGSWSPFMWAFGRAWYWPALITVWHVEPDGRDAGEVCRQWEHGQKRRAWRWHVWHWRLQVGPLQKARRWVFERCELCGRRYPYSYSPISHQWDRRRDGHWWNITAGAYHHECSELVSLRRGRDQDVDLLKQLVSLARVLEDKTENEWVNDHLWSPPCGSGFEFNDRYRLYSMLGYGLDGDRLVKRVDTAGV